MSTKKVLILVDNLRMGGIQRLALDQLCMLSDLRIPAELHFRQVDSTLKNPNFLNLEANRILKKNLLIFPMPEIRVTQFFYLIKLLRKQQFSDVVNFSLGGTVLLKLAKIISCRRPIIHTIIEQLPSLSAPIQRYKRFLYASFTDKLYGYSHAVVFDWNHRLDFICRNLVFRKKRPSVHRNGVYLDRLPTVIKVDSLHEVEPRLVFIGRNVSWKNPDLVFSLLKDYGERELKALIVVPYLDADFVKKLRHEFKSRVDFEIGKGIEDILFREGDIHVYPVNYGPNAKFIESVSINCLEMACLGIPSLVTQHGARTWPELVNLGLLLEVDWNSPQSIQASIKKASEFLATESIISSARKVISIKQNLDDLLQL